MINASATDSHSADLARSAAGAQDRWRPRPPSTMSASTAGHGRSRTRIETTRGSAAPEVDRRRRTLRSTPTRRGGERNPGASRPIDRAALRAPSPPPRTRDSRSPAPLGRFGEVGRSGGESDAFGTIMIRGCDAQTSLEGLGRVRPWRHRAHPGTGGHPRGAEARRRSDRLRSGAHRLAHDRLHRGVRAPLHQSRGNRR